MSIATTGWSGAPAVGIDISVGYAVCLSGDGARLTIATDAAIASSPTGAIEGIATTPGSGPNITFTYLPVGPIPKEFLPFVGAGNGTDFALRGSDGRIVRSASLTPQCVGLCREDGSVVLDLTIGGIASLVVGGSGILTGISDGSVVSGRGITTAAAVGDPTRLTNATPAALSSGFMPYGVALATVPLLGIVLYAGVGSTVAAAIVGGTPGDASWAILDATGLPIRKKSPTASDVVIGEFTARGDLHVLPQRFDRCELNLAHPPYSVDTTGIVDISTAFRQAVIDADISVAESSINFSARRIILPKGILKLDKPVHCKTEALIVQGEGRLIPHLKATSFVGPSLYLAPDIGVFPTVPSSLGGNALVLKREVQVQDEHWFSFGNDGAGANLDTKSAMSIEMWIRVNSTTVTGTSFIAVSYGRRFSDDTAWAYSEGWGIGYSNTGGSPTSKSIFFTLTTTAGILSVFTPNNSLLSDGSLHHVEANWSSGQMRIFIDGVAQTLSNSGALAGTIVQKYWESATMGGVYQYFMMSRERASTDFYLDAFRLSATARHTTGFTPPAAKFGEDANTVLNITGELDGVFVKARARGVASSTALFDAYYPHRRDNVAVVGGMVDVVVSDIMFTNLYGTAIQANSTFNGRYERITAVSKNGIRLDNNCFKSSVADIFLSSSSIESNVGISMSGAANVMSMRNVNINGFDVAYVVIGAGDIVVEGSFYCTVFRMGIFVALSVNFTWLCDSEISDEASTISGKIPELFLGLVANASTYFTAFQMSQVESSGAAIVLQGDGPLFLPTQNIFDGLFAAGNPASPGTFKILGTPTGYIELRGSQLKAAVPVLASGAPDSFLCFLKPEIEYKVDTVAITGTSFALTKDRYMRAGIFRFTGLDLPGVNTITVGTKATLGRRTFVNATTATLPATPFDIIVKVAGGTSYTIAPGASISLICDGVDLVR